MSETKRPLKVFLCHASADKPKVRELYERLKSEGWIDPWLDVVKLLPGQHWTTVIKQSLDDADVVIIFISNNSINREGFVQREMNKAWDLSLEKPRSVIYLIPLRLEECDVPYDLRERQWADYFGEKKEETYEALLESLKLRHEQKLKLEADEYIRREKAEKERLALEEKTRKEAEEKTRLEAEERAQQEKKERDRKVAEARVRKEAEEKARRETEELSRIEKVEKERKAAEIALQEKKKLEAPQKANREKAEREANEKAKQEKLKRDAAEKAQRERAERRATQITVLKGTLSRSFIALRSKLHKAVVPFLRIAGFAGIAIALFWGAPKIISLIPTAQVELTDTLRPSNTMTLVSTSTLSPVAPLKTITPSRTPALPSRTPTRTITAVPTFTLTSTLTEVAPLLTCTWREPAKQALTLTQYTCYCRNSSCTCYTTFYNSNTGQVQGIGDGKTFLSKSAVDKKIKDYQGSCVAN